MLHVSAGSAAGTAPAAHLDYFWTGIPSHHITAFPAGISRDGSLLRVLATQHDRWITDFPYSLH